MELTNGWSVGILAFSAVQEGVIDLFVGIRAILLAARMQWVASPHEGNDPAPAGGPEITG